MSLPREERQEVVASLRESGLSIRAIAAATGMGRGTIERTLEPAVPNGTPDVGERPTISVDRRLLPASPAPVDDEPVLSQQDCEQLDDTVWSDSDVDLAGRSPRRLRVSHGAETQDYLLLNAAGCIDARLP